MKFRESFILPCLNTVLVGTIFAYQAFDEWAYTFELDGSFLDLFGLVHERLEFLTEGHIIFALSVLELLGKVLDCAKLMLNVFWDILNQLHVNKVFFDRFGLLV